MLYIQATGSIRSTWPSV